MNKFFLNFSSKLNDYFTLFYRISLIIISVCFIVSGILIKNNFETINNPLYLRIILSLISLAIFIGTFFKKFKEIFFYFFNSLLFIIPVWISYLAFINDFSPVPTYFFITAISLTSFILRNYKEVAAFSLFTVLIIIIFKFVLKNSFFDSAALLICIFSILIIGFVVVYIKNLSEVKLIRSEEKYRFLAENISEVSWEYSMQKNKFTYISPSVIKFRGYTAEEALNQDLKESLSAESFELVLKTISEAVKDFSENPSHPKQYRIEHQSTCKDGSNVWIETVAHLQYSKNKEIEIIGVSRNFDEKKKTELVQIQNEEKFRQLIKNSFDTLVLMDASGNQIFVSESVKNATGFTPEELTNVPVIEKFVHPDDRQSLSENFYKIFSSGFGRAQYRHIHKDGHWVYLEAVGSNQLENPLIKAVVINVRDITEQKKFEAALKERELKLKLSNEEKDRFVFILAHDLRNPFNSLSGLSDLLLENINKYDIRKIEKILITINSSIKRTYNLLEDLLLWSYSQSGKLSFNPQKIDFYETCSEVIIPLQENALLKKIKISCFETKKTYLNADLNMFKTILRNLISNAIKFTNENGKISVFAEPELEFTVITVSDTGVGIDKKNQEKLWQLTEHFSTEGTAGEKGTGFGLILCKDFVEKHNGKIWVESELNKGSDFKFTVPVF